MNAGWPRPATGGIFPERVGIGGEAQRARLTMRLNMTSSLVGLATSTLALATLLSSPAGAQSNRQQMRADGGQWSHGVTVMPRYTPRDYVVCWNGCNNS